MKLITLTVVVNDFRDMDTSDDNIDELLSMVRDEINSAVHQAANVFNIALTVDED